MGGSFSDVLLGLVTMAAVQGVLGIEEQLVRM
jgi:hypothetical protein